MSEEKTKAIETAVSAINKQFGKGAIMRLGVQEGLEVAATPSGSLKLDMAMGVGGYPRGRTIEIYGPESSGKTTLTLHALAAFQGNAAKDGAVAFIDAEHALDPVYARQVGIDVDDLLISQPDTGEQALSIADMLVRSGAVDAVVVDSVAALVPKAELEGEMGDAQVGVQARMMSQAMRKLTASINQTGTTVFFINQLRQKIGVTYGSPETTTGGNALKFYADIRLDIRRTGAIKKGEDSIGNQTRVKVAKNKVAPPFKEANFEILYGEGISREGELIDLGMDYELIEKSGSWYTYEAERIGQGKDNARQHLKSNPETADTLERAIRDAADAGEGAVTEPESGSEAEAPEATEA